jgi:hypothetical protein
MALQQNSVCVIEFNYFRGVEYELIVKELAICIPQESRQQNYVFREPYPQTNLTSEVREANKLRRNCSVHYGWEEGDVPYFRLSEILCEITTRFDRVAVYGQEKCDFIAKLIRKNVINMCPGFDDFLESQISQVLVFNTCCLMHHEANRTECALAKCIRLASYMHNFKSNQVKVFENDVEMEDLSEIETNQEKVFKNDVEMRDLSGKDECGGNLKNSKKKSVRFHIYKSIV